jgi:2-polyprenyl-3-methyl-5-hydroxy-6-metoxy-1,4-benzoquinol methylase
MRYQGGFLIPNGISSRTKYVKKNDPVIIGAEQCPACQSLRTEDYLDTNLTSFFFPVPDDVIKKIKKEPFKLKICQNCSHIFQTEINKDLIELIYSEFYVHYNLDTSNEFQDVYRERTVEFIKVVLSPKKDQKILDIGCGEGTYFPFFETNGYKCFGIEPSGKAKNAKERNPHANISDEYFETSETNIFKTEFDVILMNWALEHIVEIESFFKKLKKYVKIGTKLIIQVPDTQYYFDNSLALFYVHEHINYFTIETLRLLLERKGYKIVEQKYGDCPSILICGEYTGTRREKKFNYLELFRRKKKFIQKSDELKIKINKILLKSEKIILYGMGLLAFWIGDFCLDKVDLEKVELIDDNEYYHGKIVPLFNKKLKIFSKGYNLDGALILICTSPIYHKKIRKVIKNKFTGKYKIATLMNNDIVIE